LLLFGLCKLIKIVLSTHLNNNINIMLDFFDKIFFKELDTF